MTRPRRLQEYTVLERLETGGMGEVYLGRDERTGRLAALKTLSERLSREEIYVRRFQREARLYRNLQHPNIVGCFASGFDQGLYFIAMEYIEGRSLARILEVYQRLEAPQALCILTQLADALEFAHRQYVIHRDIKPRNVMVSTEGVVKLLDFGIAHAEDQLIQTDAGQMVGTFHYASPEQLTGGKVTVRSDLYCLGLVLYEMLCCRRALEDAGVDKGEPGAACLSIKPLREVRPGLDPLLYDLVDRLLAVDPEARYPTAARLLRDVGEAYRSPALLKPLVAVFGDRAVPEPTGARTLGTLGTLATTMTTYLRRSWLRTPRGWRLLAGGAVALWVVLSFVFYFLLEGRSGAP